jgi:D-3-phosphoglycerate dehydrogenase / 2-oxoglutarate reductase
MSTILITTSSFGKNDPSPLNYLKKSGLSPVLNPFGRKLTEKEVLDLIQKHNPVGILAGVEPLTADVLGQAQSLKAIARAGIGMDSVDQNAAGNLGISVSNTPDAPTIPVAELTLGMILSLMRGIHFTDASIRSGGWERPMGNLLYGKTLGIIGCGRIGTRLAKYLKAFECRVIGCDPACEYHDHIIIHDLDTLLYQSDIISLHLPYMFETHHFMNQQRIHNMKPGSYLVNAARGGLLDENALYKALADGHLAGAALDCFEQEPYTGPLKDLGNVLLTGHIGSYAKEARVMMETQAAQNLISQLKDKGVL